MGALDNEPREAGGHGGLASSQHLRYAADSTVPPEAAMFDRSLSLLRAGLPAFLALVTLACDAAGGAGGADDGPVTRCDLGITEKNPDTGDFGEGCTSDAECDFGVCMLPGAAGNLTNSAFGFCTRGCDCDNDDAARLSDEEKVSLTCIYPTTPDQHRRHVLLQCASVADCQAVDPRWTACRTPTAGGTRKVCHAE